MWAFGNRGVGVTVGVATAWEDDDDVTALGTLMCLSKTGTGLGFETMGSGMEGGGGGGGVMSVNTVVTAAFAGGGGMATTAGAGTLGLAGW